MARIAPLPTVLGGTDGRLAAPDTEAEARRQTFITIRGLRRSFDNAIVYDGFDLDLPQGEFISIFGPNGCSNMSFNARSPTDAAGQ
jgi:ATPase subunit of ABC transporter with duplicated ATPase domains